MPKPSRMVGRALLRHCPMCGSGGLFRHWFRMEDCCPRCGFKFERVPGHWIGALGINTVVSFGLLLVVLVGGFVLMYPNPEFVPLVIACLAVGLIVPLLFQPVSRTLWTAIDLWMTPATSEDYCR